MQSLNSTHCGIRGLAVLDSSHESFQPLVGNVGLAGDRPDRQIVRIADALQQSDGVVKKVHTSHNGESFPHLSRSTFLTVKGMLAGMRSRRRSSGLAKLVGINLDKIMKYRGISGHAVAKAAKKGGAPIDAKTVNNARNARDGEEGDLTLGKLADIALGLGLEPWKLLVERFDPARPPALRKQPGLPEPSDDPYMKELLITWGNIPREDRSTALARLREVQILAEERGQAREGAPPGPSEALQKSR